MHKINKPMRGIIHKLNHI